MAIKRNKEFKQDGLDFKDIADGVRAYLICDGVVTPHFHVLTMLAEADNLKALGLNPVAISMNIGMCNDCEFVFARGVACSQAIRLRCSGCAFWEKRKTLEGC